MNRIIVRGFDKLFPPVHQRIAELLNEKGKAFSVQNVAVKLSMNRETLRMKLLGKRELYTFEQDQLISLIGLPIARVTGEDIRDEKEELRALLEDSTRVVEKSYCLATDLYERAMGPSEVCYALIDLGRVFYQKKEYKKAEQEWIKALERAKVVEEKYNNSILIETVLSLLKLSCAAQNDYSPLLPYLSVLEESNSPDYHVRGMNHYFLAKIYQQLGGVQAAKENHYKSIEAYLVTKHKTNIGRAELNTANFEYKLGNYSGAHALYMSGYNHLLDTDDSFARLLCLKGAVKSLLKSGQKSDAVVLILQALGSSEKSNVEDERRLASSFYLLYSMATNEPKYAIDLVNSVRTGPELKKLASQFLIKHYLLSGNPEMAIQYLKDSNEITSTDILDEEGL